VLAFAFLALGLIIAMPRELAANVDVILSLADLTRTSTAIATVTPLEQQSHWEGGRIVTLTRVRIDSLLAGNPTISEPIVRTLGGTIGNLTQIVDGEPVLLPSSRALLFLRETGPGTFQVAGRGQGQFPIVVSLEGGPFVVHHPRLGTLVQPVDRPSVRAAVSVLHGLALDAAEATIELAWKESHAR